MATFRTLSAESNMELSNSFRDQAESASNARNWPEVRKTATLALKKMDGNYWFRHYFYATRAFAYYAENQISRALRDSTTAVRLRPKCPYTIEIHAMVVHEYGRQKNHRASFKEALKYCKRLVNRSVESMMKDKCKPDSIRHADRIINDSYYIMGFAYWNLDKLSQARDCFSTYIGGRNSGVRSIWNLRNAKTELRELEAEISTSTKSRQRDSNIGGAHPE